jgi:hypothetical protein
VSLRLYAAFIKIKKDTVLFSKRNTEHGVKL